MNRNLIALSNGKETFIQTVKAIWGDANRFSLTVQLQLGTSEHLDAFLDSLVPWLICETETNHWPGTVLYGAKANVRFYRCTPHSLSAIVEQAGRWFWLQPEMPEDLAIYRNDGSVIFESICHEEDVLLHFTEEEFIGLPLSIREKMVQTGRQSG
ncbi:hypothetical protein [Paludibaculum fermentans]|uniref:Uncharacterized protein n=1 Tax=Paludibaculum fermentans TaxID=1473598 RepID=A0A7S7SNX1_PALFE|nr:hypothetical protein [Paludibaculum fermentans]QOY91373.1 hypothetical protein IRI77_15910 [Paludibaculum fermentans]